MLPVSQVFKRNRRTRGRTLVGRSGSKEKSAGAARRTIVAAALLSLFGAGSTGCTTFHNGFEAITNNGAWNETVIVLKNRSMSAKAWHRRKHHYCREKYTKDFAAGFRAGYEEVAGGSDGCTPAFPPQEYWSWEFQSAEGQARTSAWLAGYPHGARAAEEEGASNWTQLQMSTGLQAQYQQNGTFEHQGALYPIPDAETSGTVVPMEDVYLQEVLPEGAQWVPGPPSVPSPGLMPPAPLTLPGN